MLPGVGYCSEHFKFFVTQPYEEDAVSVFIFQMRKQSQREVR